MHKRLIQQTIKFKHNRRKRYMGMLENKELIKELLTVNAPYVKSTFRRIKELLMNKATLVFFRNEPLILFHGKQTIGYEGSPKSETLICLYRLPVWFDNILIFKCREQYCAFEIRVYLNDDPLEEFGTFSVN